MATAASHEHGQNLHFPPSPPPSPLATRRRHKKKHDPFEELARTPVPSRPVSPTDEPVDEQESLITRVSHIILESSHGSKLIIPDHPHTHPIHLLHNFTLLRKLSKPSTTDQSAFLHCLDPQLPHTLELAGPRTIPGPIRLDVGP